MNLENVEYFSLDEFEGSEPPYENKYVGFDLKKKESDSHFVMVLNTSEYSNLKEFKESLSFSIAFIQKEDAEPTTVVSLYEKRKQILLSSDNKEINKNAEKETKEIKDLELTENDDIEFDDLNLLKKSKIKKNKKI